ncbi:hypothetical protein CPB84DRAFT_1775634 [Gymnopilus junonius]|uniref:Uncharacterized protein n=1 Tax=Gymnopilus junonius TaxID=109634 RepID=A0A9P5TN41_GYMJU|nr:hypothetical protein CPB84DRAFT_1775634 [Gymnopilus junonius]
MGFHGDIRVFPLLFHYAAFAFAPPDAHILARCCTQKDGLQGGRKTVSTTNFAGRKTAPFELAMQKERELRDTERRIRELQKIATDTQKAATIEIQKMRAEVQKVMTELQKVAEGSRRHSNCKHGNCI